MPSLYCERQVAELLGLSRDSVRYLRGEHLTKKEGWTMQGRDVALTEAGLKKLLEVLAQPEVDLTPALILRPPEPAPEKKEGAPANDPAPPAPAAGAATTRPGLVELTVLRCYPNIQMLRATDPNGAQVDVRVKTNRNFVPRMTLHGRMVCPGKYEMEGRCPRSRGRY